VKETLAAGQQQPVSHTVWRDTGAFLSQSSLPLRDIFAFDLGE